MSGYNDEPTAEELELLRQDEQNATVPPAEDDDSNPITPEMVAAEAGVTTTGAPAAEPAPAAATPAAAPGAAPAPAAAPAQTEEQRFAAFLEQHKGKSPDELARLAFQQSQRAASVGFQARQSKEQLDGITERATAAIARVAARREALKGEREGFASRLAEDPDAATRDVHDRLVASEEAALAAEELGARRDQAVAIVAGAIQGFDMDATTAFGAEMNYTPEEMARVTDPRDIATLHLASLSGRLMRAGVMDFAGNILAMPQPVAATDPRLAPAAAPVTTLSSAPARGAGGGQTLEQQLTDIVNMTDKQMEELERTNPGLLESLLRKAG